MGLAAVLPLPVEGPSQDEAANFTVKAGLAQMLKGGVIMDVVNAEQVCHSHICPYIMA